MKIVKALLLAGALAGTSCAGSSQGGATSGDSAEVVETQSVTLSPAAAAFSADSAYTYMEKQVNFGPRVPGTASHRACGDWLEAELARHGATVLTQEFTATAFDGTPLPSRNIMGQFNPEAEDRILLLAHWDTRPWADEDPDPANHDKPIPGANDGASGVGVLLEVARVLAAEGTDKGIDILFVDSEDYGSTGDDDSWALGARYFAQNPIKAGYRPARAVLLDMVGGKDAVFAREYFSQENAPWLVDALWRSAAKAGYADRFVNQMGGGITDDHLQLQEVGIPAIDIIEMTPEGFNPTWHTMADDMFNIDRSSLQAVGATLLTWLSQK